jgi:hypothetical protein
MNEFENYCNEYDIAGNDSLRFKEYCQDKMPKEMDFRKAYPRFQELWLCFLLEDSLNMIGKILGVENE